MGMLRLRALSPKGSRQRRRFLPFIVTAFVFLSALFLLGRGSSSPGKSPQRDDIFYQHIYPLTWKHIAQNTRQGGAWYIPDEWLDEEARNSPPKDILQAAQTAYRLANSTGRTIPHTAIPLIVHQTWMDTKVDSWSDEMTAGVEKWLTYATAKGNSSMAYFWWLDDGCKQLIDETAPEIAEMVDSLPQMVEKSDIFRIVVTNSIGGVYQDVDTLPLRSPVTWVDDSDLLPWTHPSTEKAYHPELPIQILLGIEGDNDPTTNRYWRMGYTYPVQLTQWALASAPNNAILELLLENFSLRIAQLSSPYHSSPTLAAQNNAFAMEDPLELTGPAAITLATSTRLALPPTSLKDFSSVTGLHDGGRSKAVGSTLILPITAFSPGRGKGEWANMGSKPITHKDARVWHRAQGSWRKFDAQVEFGKFCRTVWGGCKEWSKVPSVR